MRFSTTQERAEFERLYSAYREAWQRLSLQVSYWQSLVSDGQADSAAVQRAQESVRQTEASYREHRDRLADYMLARASSTKDLVTR